MIKSLDLRDIVAKKAEYMFISECVDNIKQL